MRYYYPLLCLSFVNIPFKFFCHCLRRTKASQEEIVAVYVPRTDF